MTYPINYYIGRKYGTLTIKEFLHINENGQRVWLCECECGNTKITTTRYLTFGDTKTCGNSCHKIVDLTGKRFGKLTVVSRADDRIYKNNKVIAWNCICDCGNKKVVTSCTLKSGQTRSCGCLLKERAKTFRKTHGKQSENERLYAIWYGMNNRCYSKKNIMYHNYGGRGITVCDEWRWENGIVNFFDWAISNGYKDNLSIDRIDVNGNYEPDNCQWITMREQQRNRRDTTLYEYNGKQMLVTEIAKELGISHSKIYYRLSKGMTLQESIEEIIKRGVDTKRPVDKTKKSNIKCEHCNFWCKTRLSDGVIIDASVIRPSIFTGIATVCKNENSKNYMQQTDYWKRCKCFEWKDGGTKC